MALENLLMIGESSHPVFAVMTRVRGIQSPTPYQRRWNPRASRAWVGMNHSFSASSTHGWAPWGLQVQVHTGHSTLTNRSFGSCRACLLGLALQDQQRVISHHGPLMDPTSYHRLPSLKKIWRFRANSKSGTSSNEVVASSLLEEVSHLTLEPNVCLVPGVAFPRRFRGPR